MADRFKNAATAQSGACNPRPISKALCDAISECYAEGVQPEEDPAVFLILHQLVYVLTGHDMSSNSDRMFDRWKESTGAVDLRLSQS